MITLYNQSFPSIINVKLYVDDHSWKPLKRLTIHKPQVIILFKKGSGNRYKSFQSSCCTFSFQNYIQDGGRNHVLKIRISINYYLNGALLLVRRSVMAGVFRNRSICIKWCVRWDHVVYNYIVLNVISILFYNQHNSVFMFIYFYHFLIICVSIYWTVNNSHKYVLFWTTVEIEWLSWSQEKTYYT